MSMSGRGYKKALVGAGQAISLISSVKNGPRKQTSHLNAQG